DHSGVQAAEKCGDEVEPGRVEQEGALARRERPRQDGGDGPRPSVQSGVRETVLLLLALRQEDIGRALGCPPCPQTEAGSDRGEIRHEAGPKSSRSTR